MTSETLHDPVPCPPQLYLIIICQTLDCHYCLFNWIEPHLTCSLSVLSLHWQLHSNLSGGPLPSQGLCTCFLLSLHVTYLTSTHSWVLNLNAVSSNNSSQTPAPIIPHVCGITVGNYIPREGTVHGCIAHLCTLITVPSISHVLGKYLLNEHLSVSSQLSPLLT